jgi:hypothetical protein
MFLDIFHIYISFIFCKKKLQNICVITFHSITFLEKLQIWGKFSKKITFSEKLQQNCYNFMISTKIFIKIAFFNSKHCKQNKKYQKSFNLILKLVKITNFLIKKWKNEIFSKILKIGTFTKT